MAPRRVTVRTLKVGDIASTAEDYLKATGAYIIKGKINLGYNKYFLFTQNANSTAKNPKVYIFEWNGNQTVILLNEKNRHNSNNNNNSNNTLNYGGLVHNN